MLFGIDGNDFGGCGTYINTNEKLCIICSKIRHDKTPIFFNFRDPFVNPGVESDSAGRGSKA